MSFFNQKVLFPISLIGIYIVAALIQSVLLLNWDVSWLMLVARRLLAGGSYGKDFFEVNPPLILYLYIPPVLLSKFFSTSIVWALRCYIFGLASLSLFVCYRLSKKILPTAQQSFFILLLASIFLILPTFELGQREHLLILLMMPYVLLLALRLQGQDISFYSALGIGIMAGLGFAIKPYFVVIWMMVEGYYIFCQRQWLRPELFSVLMILISYLISIFIFQPEYFFIIIPVAMHNYYQGFSYSLSMLAMQPDFFFCFAAGLVSLYFRKKNISPALITLLFITFIGSLFSYFMQRTLWSYHLLPAFSMAILLLGLLFFELVKTIKNLRFLDYCLVIAFALVIFSYPIYYVGYTTTLLSLGYKKHFYPLIHFMKENAYEKPVYFFSATTVYAFPAMDYSHAIHASRFAFLGWLPGILSQKNPSSADKNYFMNLMTSELQENKPAFIFVDEQDQKAHLEDIQFDFLSYFSSDKTFQTFWKDYVYLTTIDEPSYYKLAVYQRKPILAKQEWKENIIPCE